MGVNDTFDYISRFVVILLAFCIAAIVAGWFLAAILLRTFGLDALLSDFWQLSDAIGDQHGSFTSIAFWSTTFIAGFVMAAAIGSFAFLPAALVILIAEARRYRSSLVYTLSGLVIGIAAIATWYPAGIATSDAQTPLLAAALAGTGVIGGFVYWLLAGRNAGRMFDRPAQK